MEQFSTRDQLHHLSFNAPFQPLEDELLPDETLKAFSDELSWFPLGSLEYQDIDGADLFTALLFHDRRRLHFFCASLDQIAEKYAKRIDAIHRDRQKKDIRNLYWGSRTLKGTATR